MTRSKPILIASLFVSTGAQAAPEDLNHEALRLLETRNTPSPQDLEFFEARLLTAFWAGMPDVPFHLLWLFRGLRSNETTDLRQFLALLGERKPATVISHRLTIADAKILAAQFRHIAGGTVAIRIPPSLSTCDVELDGVKTRIQNGPLRSLTRRKVYVRTQCDEKIQAYAVAIPEGTDQFFLPPAESNLPQLP
jgi:hypothetical protein